MEKKYLNSPINEALCAFTLDSQKIKWDITYPGIYFEKVKNRFPYKEQPSILGLPQGAPVVRFYSEDRKNVVQMGPNVFSVHRLKPYQEWNLFKEDIAYAFNKFQELVGTKDLPKIGLRYINHIEIKSDRSIFSLDEYFRFRPVLGDPLPKDMNNFIVGCEMLFCEKRDILRFQLSPLQIVPFQVGVNTFFLDLDYSVVDNMSIGPVGWMEWVENAHMTIEGIFEGCITDKLRALFQEETI